MPAMKKHWLIILLFYAGPANAQFVVNTGIPVVNSASVNINGDWDNQSSSFLNNGIVTISGNWNSTGGYSASGTGGFTLNNSLTQQFNHNRQSVAVLVKNGSGDTQVNNPLTINDSLTLQVGLLAMTSANHDTLIIKQNATVSANPSSYVVGKITRLGTGDLFFPVSRALNYLPITIHNVSGSNPKVTLSVEDTPAGYSIVGIGNSLIGFPYLWRSSVTGADTASYVEVQYPTALVVSPSPVVTRRISANQFESMARRHFSVISGFTKIESYEGGLRGIFSIAQGSSLIQDSIALLTLYDSTRGTNWTVKTNWVTGRLNNWFGITITGNRVSGLALPNNNLKGPVPVNFIDLQNLTTVDLSSNKIKTLPDLSTLTKLTTLNVSSNQLDFASLIANASISGINYSSQANLGTPLDTLVNYGTDYNLKVSTKGVGNVYQWTREGTPVAGAVDSTYQITAINRGNMGTYVCQVTNPAVPSLTLKTNNKRVRAVATLSGQFILPDNTAINKGDIILFKVTPVGAYDTTFVKPVSADGTYVLDKVVLDDYVLLGKADTIAFPGILPTYYSSIIFWEQADTLQVQGNRIGLNIVAVAKPTPSKGEGSISGTLEDIGNSVHSGGRVEAARRIAGAGVSASRSQSSGRTQANKYILTAYTVTDENGAFILGQLPTGSYRLNVQYPGFPMDTTSFINFTIGSEPSTKEVIVDAQVDGNKIVVHLLKITGTEGADNRFTLYPNPTRYILSIELNQPLEDGAYSISNAQGQTIKSGILNPSGANAIDVSSLSPGIYIVQLLQLGHQIKNFKIVKE